MGTTRTLDLPPGPNGEPRTKQVTHLQWSLQFAMLKIQEMVCPHNFASYISDRTPSRSSTVGRQISVVLFSSEQRVCTRLKRIEILIRNACKETDNVVNQKDGGYDHITEFIRIAQPNADTLAKLATLEAADVAGDRS